MISSLKLKNFTAFRDLEIDFSSRINVIIGENGTGKTHLLKAAHTLCSANKAFSDIRNVTGSELSGCVAGAFNRSFFTEGGRIGKLHQQGAAEDTMVAFRSNGGHELACSFNARSSTRVSIEKDLDYLRYSYKPVYIPAKEVLSFLEGIFNGHLLDPFSRPDEHLAVVKKMFDGTYLELAWKLVFDREREGDNKARWVKEALVNKIGGRFIFAGPIINFQTGSYQQYAGKHAASTYFAPIAKEGFEAGLMAEGFRKIGILQRLLEIEAIGTGGSGPLFWDEPEANMNPKLMKMIVEALLELSRAEQQIILATHDYVLLKWFDLLMDKGKSDHVRFHTLYRDIKSGEVNIASTDDYREIEKNPIAEAFNNLTVAHAKSRLKEISSE